MKFSEFIDGYASYVEDMLAVYRKLLAKAMKKRDFGWVRHCREEIAEYEILLHNK